MHLFAVLITFLFCKTALHFLTDASKVEEVNCILKKGADFHAINMEGKTSLDNAVGDEMRHIYEGIVCLIVIGIPMIQVICHLYAVFSITLSITCWIGMNTDSSLRYLSYLVDFVYLFVLCL